MPDLVCYAPLHLCLLIHNSIVLILFVLLSAPLLIALGNASLLYSERHWSPHRRVLERLNPARWWDGVKRTWPPDSGAFARRRHYFHFETGLLMCKVFIPVSKLMTTYNH